MKTKLTDLKAKLLKHCILIAILFIVTNHINYAQLSNDCKESLVTDFNLGDWRTWFNQATLTEDLDEVFKFKQLP